MYTVSLMKSVAIAVVLSSNLLFSAELTYSPVGTVTMFYSDFDLEYSAVDLMLSGQHYNTGPIHVGLDLTNPSNQFVALNFNSMTLESHVSLLVTFPLLQSLGQPAQRIRVNEISNVVVSPSKLPLEQPISLSITGVSGIQGEGSFGAGQFLAGWKFSNMVPPIRDPPFPRRPPVLDPPDPPPPPDGEGTPKPKEGGDLEFGPPPPDSEEGQPKLSNPDGTQVVPLQMPGPGRVTLQPAPVPEPRTFILFAVGLAGLGAASLRKR